MRYTLVWIPSADDELARIWMDASDRRAVADATNEIERLLKREPLSVGEEYDDDRRIVIDPLEVIYTVSPDDCMVRVIWVAWSSQLPAR
jgi:hypothetical protein